MHFLKLKTAMLMAAAASLAFMACVSSTALIKDWRDSNFKGKSFETILVLAVIKDDVQRQNYERIFAERLKQHNVTGFAGHTLIDNAEDYGNKPKLLNVVKANRIDAVLLAKLISVEKTKRQVPTSFEYVPTLGYGYTLIDYHSKARRQIYQPGYITVDTTIKLETTLFDSDTEKMVWAAGTKSFNPNSAETVISENANLAIASMKKAGFLP